MDIAARSFAPLARSSGRSAPLAIVVAAATLARADYAVDDALIFAQFARNIATRGEWAFNAGEPVYATTSVLWTLLLVPIELCTLPNPTAIAVLYAAGIFVLALGVGELLEPLGEWARLGGALAVALCPLLWKATGMETSWFLALVVWAIVAHLRGRSVLAGLCVGLATLTRPDAALVCALLLADAWTARRTIEWKTPLVAALVCVPWLAYAAVVFGSVVPLTLQAKTAQSTLGWWAAQPVYPIAALRSLPAWPLALACLIASALPARDGARFRGANLLLAFGLCQTAAYAWLGAPSGYFWYYAPLSLSAVIATVKAARHVSEHSRWLVFPLAALLAFSCFELARTARLYRHSLAYREAARAIAEHSAPFDRIAAAEIGYLGYESRRKVLDMHGLIHPSARAEIERGRADWWTDARPRFVVVHEPSWYAEPTNLPDYELFARFRESSGSALAVWRARSP